MAKAKNKTIYVCQSCGAQKPRWEGRCTDCGEWNTLVEEKFTENSGGFGGKSPQRGWANQGASSVHRIKLDQSHSEAILNRSSTGLEELDRVLGGGLAESSFVLLGGAPGIGKSTLLLQMAHGLAKNNKKILYISAEESTAQTASRAHRLGIKNEQIEIASESNMNLILEISEKLQPDVLIVDSVQTIFVPEITSAPGSVSQVREAAGQLMLFAKKTKTAVVLIGHVTKDGNLAGPKVLEHMVDCVLSFEGDSNSHFRLLRTLKNRFGSAQELGVFEMGSLGLREVKNPSELFLQERSQNRVGSSIFCSLEGTRPLLCEIQALTLKTQNAFPRRTSLGIDINRLHLLTAVLERHLGLKLSFSDLYINVVGGLRIEEPSVDLSVAASIMSSDRDLALPGDAVFLGEIGLTGEVRAITFPELRIKESIKLGFKQFYLPFNNQRHFEDPGLLKKIRVNFIKNVHDLDKVFGREF